MRSEKLCDEICLMAKSRKILEGTLRELKRRGARDLLRVSIDATLSDVNAMPGVATAKSVNGSFVISLAPGTDQREFLRRALDRHRIDSFSQKEPDLEEIYLEAVRASGMEETRTIE